MDPRPTRDASYNPETAQEQDPVPWAEALLAAEKRLLEMVAGGYGLTDVLDALCRAVDTAAPECRCSVLLVDAGGRRMEQVVGPSLSRSYLASLEGRPVDPDAGPCGMSASLNEAIIAADIAADPRWESWRPVALAHGLRACWSTPIAARTGRVLGTFALYCDEPRAPGTLHQRLIDQFTHIARIAIERAQSEAALRQHEAFLAEAQRLSSTGSFLWRVTTAELVWSEQTYRIYELDPAQPVTFELVGTRIHPDESAWFQDLLLRATRDGDDLEFEHRLRLPDGSIRYLHVVAHATRDHGGQLEYIGAVQDVTERRRSDDALNRLRSELGRMARITTLGALTASIAHEVNQPLAGIVANASTSLRMLADEPPNLEGARETARRTIRDATRDVLAILGSELQRAGAIVRADLAADLPAVTGDRVQLQQVVVNLVMNATEAMREVADRPRQLTVRTAGVDGEVQLSVEDSGSGFDPQHAARLFEPFYSTKDDGMGIGLFISRSIVESHGGRLSALRNDRGGATFVCALPRSPPPGRRDDPPAPRPGSEGVR